MTILKNTPAATTDVDAVREAMWGRAFPNLTGGMAGKGVNHHLSKPALIGATFEDGRVNMFTFGLGSGIAGIAGVAIGRFAKVTSELGSDCIGKSFMTVVVGGVGNIRGTLPGAGLIGTLQKGIEWPTPSNPLVAQTCMTKFIIIFIQFRPRGIIALNGRAAGDRAMERSFLAKNPSELIFLGAQALFPIAVTVAAHGYGMGLISTGVVDASEFPLAPGLCRQPRHPARPRGRGRGRGRRARLAGACLRRAVRHLLRAQDPPDRDGSDLGSDLGSLREKEADE